MSGSLRRPIHYFGSGRIVSQKRLDELHMEFSTDIHFRKRTNCSDFYPVLPSGGHF